MATRGSTDDPSGGTKLRRDMHALLAEARRNEKTLRKFQALELRLLGCRSLAELTQMLLHDHRASFDWDVATLVLMDPEHELRRLMEGLGLSERTRADVMLVADPGLLPRGYRALRRPALGAWREAAHAALFPAKTEPLTSVAILPLVRNGVLIGSLNVGSRDPQRFRPGTGTDFLAHLAAIIAVCLETVIAQERLKRAGLTDALTGVNNRRFFDQRLPEEIARAWRSQSPLSLLLMDIDHFKAINDAHGHLSGDRALQAVAALIRQQLRAIDVVARYGGEEFAVLLAGADGVAAVEVAERIRRCVAAQRFTIEDHHTLALSLSTGVASLDLTSSDRQDIATAGTGLIEAADRALYEAKRDGRNRVVCALE
jgi:two-component system, cell cycle response regulator